MPLLVFADVSQSDGMITNPSEQPRPLLSPLNAHLPSLLKEKFRKNTETFSDFPTLHPLVAHFPIVLMLSAFPLYLIGLFFQKKEFKQVAIALTLIGCLGTLLASYMFRPQTVGLQVEAEEVLKNHSFYADRITYFSAYAAILGFLELFQSRKIFLEVIVSMLLLICVAAVLMTGYYGIVLTHLHGVGPQGKFLIQEPYQSRLFDLEKK